MAYLPLCGWALPDDNQQPINIQSDRATQKNFKDGEKTQYFGNVVMSQGSLIINGDHIIIDSANRKISRILAKGSPAKFQQQSDPQKSPIKAAANSIDYRLKNETIVLEGNASIEQDGATVTGSRIAYNVASERVSAEERVNMVFTPASAEDNRAGSNKKTANANPASTNSDQQTDNSTENSTNKDSNANTVSP
jgi:lipopolysaccharide export system protein LptA